MEKNVIKKKELSLPQTEESKKFLLPEEIKEMEKPIEVISFSEEEIHESQESSLVKAIMLQLGGKEIKEV